MDDTPTPTEYEIRRFVIEITISFDMECPKLDPIGNIRRDRGLANEITNEIKEQGLFDALDTQSHNFNYTVAAGSGVVK